MLPASTCDSGFVVRCYRRAPDCVLSCCSLAAHGYWLLRMYQDLEMLTEMRRKDRLEFWSDTLQVEEDGVCAALLGVAGLVSVS